VSVSTRLVAGATQIAVQGALTTSLAPAGLRAARAFADPEAAQIAAWRRVQRVLVGTRTAARAPGLVQIAHPQQLRDVTGAVSYDDVAEDAAAAAAGEPAVLTNTPIVRFERSGGSSGAQKLLPMTRAFLADLQRGVGPWLFDLYTADPALLSTSSYWSISPIGQKQSTTAGGIPIGAVDDAEYLPAAFAGLLAHVLVSHKSLATIDDVADCRRATLRLLLARDDLGLLSVWSPTFLLLLLDELEGWSDVDVDAVVDDIARGTCTLRTRAAPADLPLRADPARATALRTIAQRHGRLAPQHVWPRLRTVSMWTDGESARFVDDVARRLPGVRIQGKGLLATEGIVSIPMAGAVAPVVAVDAHVYEFVDDHGGVKLAHELAVGDEAEVLLTTSAGLVRYRLGDRVRCVGHHKRTPCLRFLGRSGGTSDLVGEKLSPVFVADVLARAARGLHPPPRFALVAPHRAQGRYVVYVEGVDDSAAAAFAHAVDDAFCAGHPYRYAKQLGQLKDVEAVVVDRGAARYEAWRIKKGQRAGDIKAAALVVDDDVHAVFAR
jgi:hypothetical protein